ncbi:MAG: c-type cytochrome [Gemmatimonadales bacterium]
MRRLVLALVGLAACHGAAAPRSDSTTPPDSALRAPDGSVPPRGPLGTSIVRGRAIFAATRDSLPSHVGGSLGCASCHLDDGRNRAAMPLLGAYARFPQFRWRSASVERIENRINDCFLRSLNGTALAWDDPGMRDLVAYLAFLSQGVSVGDTSSFPLDSASRGDSIAGAAVYRAQCARCHGSDGAGSTSGPVPYPPLWGDQSYNIGAGMARIRTLASFIVRNMPRDRAGTLSAAQAIDVAAYVAAQPRPDFPAKGQDWPCGHRPPDVPYPAGHADCRLAPDDRP